MTRPLTETLAREILEDAEPPLVCEQCGNHVDSLREVYSEDRSVGYSESRWMCETCREVQ